MSHPHVVIFSREGATEVDGVIDHLRACAADVRRINLCQYPEFCRATLNNGRLRVDADEYDLASSRTVAWLQTYQHFSLSSHAPCLTKDLGLATSGAFWDSVFSAARGQWLNPPEAIRASGKGRQLELARAIGIPTLPYIISNDVSAILAFVRENPDSVFKTIGPGYIEIDGKGTKFLTRASADIRLLPELQTLSTPVLVQTRIRAMREVRVTVVDGECFSVAIDRTGLPESTVDIRALDFQELRHRFTPTTAARAERLSVLLLKELGLRFGGVDWIEGNDKEAVFLECNALASFKWYELRGAGDITGAMSRALLSRWGKRTS